MHKFADAFLSLLRRGCALAFLATACGGGEANQVQADISLVATTEDVFSIGGVDAPDWQQFGEIADVRFDGTGGIVLLDRLRSSVAVVDPKGGFRHSVSRVGEGPGELRIALGIEVLPDSRLIVSDLGHSAFLLFDDDGQFVEQFAFGGQPAADPLTVRSGQSAPSLSINPIQVPILVGALSGARLLTVNKSARTFALHDLGKGISDFYRAYGHSAGAEPGGDVSADGRVEVRGGSLSGSISPTLEFGPPLEAAVLSDGRVVVVDSVGYRVKVLRDDGALDVLIERPIDPVPVTSEMQNAARRRRRSGGDGVFLPAPGSSAEAAEAVLSAFFAEAESKMEFAAEVPVISGIAVDSKDRIWVARTGDDGVSRGPTDVFTAGGDYIGTLAADDFRVPDAFGPSGLMAYSEVDDLGAATVRVLRLLGLEVAASSNGSGAAES